MMRDFIHTGAIGPAYGDAAIRHPAKQEVMNTPRRFIGDTIQSSGAESF